MSSLPNVSETQSKLKNVINILRRMENILHAKKEEIAILVLTMSLELTSELSKLIPELIDDANKLKKMNAESRKNYIIDSIILELDLLMEHLNKSSPAFANSNIDEIIWRELRSKISAFAHSYIEVVDNKLKIKKPNRLFCCFNV